MKKFISVILDIVSAIFTCVATLVIIINCMGFINHEYNSYVVLTGSMEPAIKTNSLIVVHNEDFAEGDVISFYSSDPSIKGAINTHRVVSIDGDVITTKGDANDFNDRYPVHRDDVIGKVIYCSVFLGQILTFMSNPFIFFGCIVIPLMIMIIYSIMDAVRYSKELKDD